MSVPRLDSDSIPSNVQKVKLNFLLWNRILIFIYKQSAVIYPTYTAVWQLPSIVNVAHQCGWTFATEQYIIHKKLFVERRYNNGTVSIWNSKWPAPKTSGWDVGISEIISRLNLVFLPVSSLIESCFLQPDCHWLVQHFPFLSWMIMYLCILYSKPKSINRWPNPVRAYISRSDCLVGAEFTTRPQQKGTNQWVDDREVIGLSVLYSLSGPRSWQILTKMGGSSLSIIYSHVLY